MTDQERLWEIIRESDCKNKSEFARKLKYKESRTYGIDWILERGHPITDNFANRIVRHIPKWNFNYVRYGTGEKFDVKIDEQLKNIDKEISENKKDDLDLTKSKLSPDMVALIEKAIKDIGILEARVTELENVNKRKKAVERHGKEASKNGLAG